MFSFSSPVRRSFCSHFIFHAFFKLFEIRINTLLMKFIEIQKLSSPLCPAYWMWLWMYGNWMEFRFFFRFMANKRATTKSNYGKSRRKKMGKNTKIEFSERKTKTIVFSSILEYWEQNVDDNFFSLSPSLKMQNVQKPCIWYTFFFSIEAYHNKSTTGGIVKCEMWNEIERTKKKDE